jgi:hypothetical protein
MLLPAKDDDMKGTKKGSEALWDFPYPLPGLGTQLQPFKNVEFSQV